MDDCGVINDIAVVNYLTTEDVAENLQNIKDNLIHMPYYGKINSQFNPGTRLHIIGKVKFISEYQFRVKADIVDTVYIQGDIKLKAVIFERQRQFEDKL